MLEAGEDNDETVMRQKPEEPAPRRRPKRLYFPRRAPSLITPPRERIYITPDKTTCVECTCFPKEEPYQKPKKLNQCQKSPLTLYELAAAVVDRMRFPEAFDWSEEDVASWMADVVGLPEYRECIFDNHINGRRLLMLEDPSRMPQINIRCFEHIQMITSKIHQLFSTEFLKFARSIGLPPRYPLTHCTWFKSRTGPSWGIRQNWSRCDILRWMKILMPAPVYLDHWDLVWYHKPEFPKVKLARVPRTTPQVHIPHYEPQIEICYEYLEQRKFRLDTHIAADEQHIWMERRPKSTTNLQPADENKPKSKPKRSRLEPKKVNARGLAGKDLILARRKMPNPKFLPHLKSV